MTLRLVDLALLGPMLVVGLPVSGVEAPLPEASLSTADTLALTPAESTAVSAVADWIRVSRADPQIWPGYDPAGVPTIVYVPERWAMVLSPPSSMEEAGLRPPPDGWPDVDVPARIRTGWLGDLVGQLVFDAEVGEAVAVAVPLQTELPEGFGSDLRLANFAFVAHEAFHQHQRGAFRSVETRPEERYPILDARNVAWATLEMRVLDDAVAALSVDDSTLARAHAESFVATRSERWRRLDEPAREIERQKEHVEGTAKYVEVRSVGRLEDRDEAAYLHEEFERYFEAGALRPADVARNRVYAVGAAVGLLLDVFDPDWKRSVEAAPNALALAERLEQALGVPVARRDLLVRDVRQRYGYEAVRRRTDRLVAEHVEAFRARERELEEGAGVRVEIVAPRLSRSRASREARLTVDRGERAIARYVVYTLRHEDAAVRLEVRDRTVLETEPPDGDLRISPFRADGIESLRLDGVEVDPGGPLDRAFATIVLEAPGARFESRAPGRIVVEGRSVRIEIPLLGA